jgi:anti-sigma factor RsiW
MIDDQDERLLQDELDGVASPEGSKRLRERLAQSAEVRARRQELQRVTRALDQVRMEEAPADFKEGVMAAIAAAERPSPARTGWLENPGSAFRRRPVLAWAYPFLAGAVSGGLLIALATGNLAPRARTDLPVIGAMLPGSDRGALADHRELRLGTARVALETRRATDGVRVGFEVAQARGAELTLEFDIAALQPVGLWWERPGEHQAELGAGTLRLRVTEDDRGTVVLSPTRAGDALILVKFHHAGESVEAVLHTATLGPGR